MSLFLAAASAALLHSANLSAPVECGHLSTMKSAFARGYSPTFEKPWILRFLEGLTDTDVQSVLLDLEPNFATSAIAGTATTVVKSNVDNLTQFHFRLGNNFNVSAAMVDGNPVSFAFDDSTHAHVDLAHPYNSGQSFTLVITYSGVVQSGGFGSIEFGTHNGASYCFTLSEPWYSYTWWPNKDDNTDKSLMSINVTVPNAMQVAANGLLQGVDDLGNGKLRFRWASSNPMSPYLLCFGATNFNHFSDTFTYTGGTMPLEFYIWPENDTSNNRTAWLGVKQMLATLGDWYGPYPFLNEKYGIYQFSFGGGQEHQTMTGENSFGSNLSVHELSHQWWGDNVTCGTWSDIWLNEGFATYSEAVWLEKKPGSSGLPALKAAMQARIPSSVGDTVYVYNPTDVNRIFSYNYTYLKGGWVQHMLRHVVGDANFWAGLALYRSRFSLGAPITEDYKKAMQDQSGMNLIQFFQQWIYQPGAPQYQYGWTNLAVNGQNYVAMHVKQVQSSNYPTFVMPVDVRLTAGSTTTVVANDKAGTQWFLYPTPATATAATLDPDGWILNTGISNVAYVPGPPKVVTSNPPPGGAYTGSPITVTFSTQINITPRDVWINGAMPTPIRVGPSFNAATNTLTVVLLSTLKPGNYTLVVNDSVTAVNSGLALDGERNGMGAGAFPSGDGLPGGALTIPFTIQ